MNISFMHIGFFTPTYLPEKNGATTRVDGLCKGLSSQGHRVFLFVPATTFSREEKQHCIVFRIPHPKLLIGGVVEDKIKFHFGRYLSFSKICMRVVEEENIEVLHARQP